MKPTDSKKDRGTKSLYLLSKYAPNIAHRLGFPERAWVEADAKLNKRMAIAEREIAPGGVWQAPTALLDFAIKAEFDEMRGTGDGARGLRLLKYVDEQVGALLDVVPENLLPSARSQLLDLLTNFAANQSQLLEKVGEVGASLYVLRKTGATLGGFESPIPGHNTTFDMLIRLASGVEVPIEFLNIHVKDERLPDESALDAFLDGRIKDKVRRKVGLEIYSREELPFPLLLILWFKQVETLQRFARRIMSRASGHELPICVLQQFGTRDGPMWQFASVHELVEAFGLLQQAA